MIEKIDYTPVSEFGDIITGKTPSTFVSEYWNGNIPFITPTDIKGYDMYKISKTERYITKLGMDSQKKTILPKDTICISCIASIGKICITNEEYSITNQQINSIIVNENYDTKYIYYCFRYYLPYLQLIAGGTGSGTPIISKNKFAKLKYPIHQSKDIQHKISNILSTYDDLIEKNNRKIEILQEMAEELYKEWFVRFRFPGYKTAKFENGIPDGWERKKIKEYYDTCSGGTPNRSNELYYLNGTYKWIKTGEIKDTIIVDTEEYITEQALNSSSAKLLPANAVIMAMYGVNIGMLGYIDGEMTCNQACCVFSDKRDFSSKHYLFYYLKSIREYLLLISFGAAQQNLSQELIKKIKILMPSDNVVKAFENKIEPIYQNIRNLILSNNNLKQQRDLLLPRLMSGKLEVKVKQEV